MQQSLELSSVFWWIMFTCFRKSHALEICFMEAWNRWGNVFPNIAIYELGVTNRHRQHILASHTARNAHVSAQLTQPYLIVDFLNETVCWCTLCLSVVMCDYWICLRLTFAPSLSRNRTELPTAEINTVISFSYKAGHCLCTVES